MSEIKIIRLPEVKEMTSFSKSKIYDLMSKDEFPKNYSKGRSTSFWLKHEIEEWILKLAGGK